MKIFNERITPTLILSSFQEANVCSIYLVPSIPMYCKLEYSQSSQLCLRTPGWIQDFPTSGVRGKGADACGGGAADPGGPGARLPLILRFGGPSVQFKSSTKSSRALISQFSLKIFRSFFAQHKYLLLVTLDFFPIFHLMIILLMFT